MSMLQGLAILGSTGSIGRSTLDVAARHPDRYTVVALAAASRWEILRDQCRKFRPRFAVIMDLSAATQLRAALAAEAIRTEVLVGPAALSSIVAEAEVHIVMAAIVGSAGLLSTLAAARAGKRVLLANKEALVMSGQLLLDAVAAGGAQLLPIDSEHNAIFQCLPPHVPGVAPPGVRRVVLTASGGPFLRSSEQQLRCVTPAAACAHPKWVMGPKISVDSATLMNKGLECIEAQLLFGMAPEAIEVLIHPQSIVHSLVEYLDGSMLAQLGNPDMRTPIAHALAWPQRLESGVESLDLARLGALEFERPDLAKFRCLALAVAAGRRGGTAPAILNAANEVAVAEFLGGRLNFSAIPRVIETVMERYAAAAVTGLEDILEVDRAARALALTLIQGGISV